MVKQKVHKDNLQKVISNIIDHGYEKFELPSKVEKMQGKRDLFGDLKVSSDMDINSYYDHLKKVVSAYTEYKH